jgi:anti-anti-sigma factor
MALSVTDRTRVIEVSGELDLSSGDELEALAAPMLTAGAEVAILLREVEFADSSGLGALLALQQRADEAGARLLLVDPSPALRRVLEVTATGELFDVLERPPA